MQRRQISRRKAPACCKKRKERHGRVLSHRRSAIQAEKPVWQQRVQKGARKSGLSAGEHPPKRMPGDSHRQKIDSPTIQGIGSLRTDAGKAKQRGKQQKQIAVVERGAISPAIVPKRGYPDRKLPGGKARCKRFGPKQMKIKIIPGTQVRKKERNTGKNGCSSKDSQVPPPSPVQTAPKKQQQMQGEKSQNSTGKQIGRNARDPGHRDRIQIQVSIALVPDFGSDLPPGEKVKGAFRRPVHAGMQRNPCKVRCLDSPARAAKEIAGIAQAVRHLDPVPSRLERNLRRPDGDLVLSLRKERIVHIQAGQVGIGKLGHQNSLLTEKALGIPGARNLLRLLSRLFYKEQGQNHGKDNECGSRRASTVAAVFLPLAASFAASAGEILPNGKLPTVRTPAPMISIVSFRPKGGQSPAAFAAAPPFPFPRMHICTIHAVFFTLF